MKIGYARVSTDEQNLNLQEDALRAAGCEKIFMETASGVSKDRPELRAALTFARDGDTLVVWKLCRLGRSLSQLIQTVEKLNKEGIQFECLSPGMDTTTPSGKMIFGLFAVLAEFERDLLTERTNAGLAAAKARGRVGGRPKAVRSKQVPAIQLAHEEGVNIASIARDFKVSRSTINRVLTNPEEYC